MTETIDLDSEGEEETTQTPTASRTRFVKRESSWVFQHLEDIDGKRKCKFCTTLFSLSAGTGTVGKHLKKHNISDVNESGSKSRLYLEKW
jgi:NADH:ubiquinone oxidoreductase subunit E